ncbi:agamous-like MADS-box protein AGL29 [Panicum virgatum]|uniref:MADS-box domain-containing protein n=1 Tax=Panicum virgatum TaxID=38727 RepID=A0A8T0V7M2_PANVG|nr:agamous-like MADS-box protein AGL29 [Panicum virgatum]KAG2632731.1 hypothetical protein PVAP13_2NG122200 [Panicum virgatum]
MVKGQKSKGRQKIEIKRIENEEARQVCFSKRRQGLFKKASELSILCGAMVGAIVFSPAGRSFSFGHPSIDEIISRFLNSVNPNGPAPGGPSHDSAVSSSVTDTVSKLNMELLELEQSLESEKKKQERLQEATEKLMGERMMQWLTANIFELGLDELQEFQKKLEEIHVVVKEKINQVLVQARPYTPAGSLPQLPMEIASTSQSANPLASTAPSSRAAPIGGFQMNYPLLSGGVHGVGGMENFPSNQNHG